MPEVFALAIPEIVDAAGVGIGAAEIGADVGIGAEAAGLGAADIAAADVAGLGAAADIGGLAAADILPGAADLASLGSADVAGAVAPDFVDTGLGFSGDVTAAGGGGFSDLGTTIAPTGLQAETAAAPTDIASGLGAPDTTFQSLQASPGGTFDPNTGSMTFGDTAPYQGPPTAPPTPDTAPNAFETFASDPFAPDTIQPPTSGDLQMQLQDTLQGGPVTPTGATTPITPGVPSGPTGASANFFGTGTVPDSGVGTGLTGAGGLPFTPAESIYAPLQGGPGQLGGLFSPSTGAAPFDPGAELLNPSSIGTGSDTSFQQAALNESLSLGPTGDPAVFGGPVASPPGALGPTGFTDIPETSFINVAGWNGVGPVPDFTDLGLGDFSNLNTGTSFADAGVTSGVDIGAPAGSLGENVSSNLLGDLASGVEPTPPMGLGMPPSELGTLPAGGDTSAFTTLGQNLDTSFGTMPGTGFSPTLDTGAPLDSGGVGAGADITGGGGVGGTTAAGGGSLLSKPIGGIGTLGQIGQVGALAGTGIMALMGPGGLPKTGEQAAFLASKAGQSGQELINNALAGKITPSQQAQLDQMRQAALSKLVQQMYAEGRDPNTDSSFQLAVQQIDASIEAQRQQFIDQAFSEGLQQLQLAEQGLQAASSQQVALDQAFQTSLANALGAASRLGAGGTTTINVPAGSTVT